MYPIAASTYLQAVESLLQGVDKVNTNLFTPPPPQAALETPKQPPPPAQKKGAPAAAPPAATSVPVQSHPPISLTVPLHGCSCLLKQSVDGAIKVRRHSMHVTDTSPRLHSEDSEKVHHFSVVYDSLLTIRL